MNGHEPQTALQAAVFVAAIACEGGAPRALQCLTNHDARGMHRDSLSSLMRRAAPYHDRPSEAQTAAHCLSRATDLAI